MEGLIINKILTVSIAAYNVEKYLEQTLRTLDDARFRDDIEVLIIDDGSKDSTGEIARKYQSKEPGTFIYIRKENGGHGSTINKGIELASGKYFRLLDGDDWVDTDEFSRYIHDLKLTYVDMILTPYKRNELGKETIIYPGYVKEDGKSYAWDDINININLISIHSLTIRTSLLKERHIHITEKCYYVDIEYLTWSIYLAKTLTCFQYPVYIYRYGTDNQSINIKNMVKNIDMQYIVSCRLAELYAQFMATEHLPKLQSLTIYNRVSSLIAVALTTRLLLDTTKQSRKSILELETAVKERSSNLYKRIGNDRKMIKALRFHNYLLLPIIRIYYRIRVKFKLLIKARR